eukprot:1139582-Pelagomonas_calceolata.AAC.4
MVNKYSTGRVKHMLGRHHHPGPARVERKGTLQSGVLDDEGRAAPQREYCTCKGRPSPSWS